MAFVGDIFPANLPYTIGYGIGSEFEKHQGEFWLNTLQKMFRDTDIVFGNFESPFVENKLERETKPFAGNPSFAEFLRKVGFNVLNLANNHILQYGNSAFDNTIDILNKNDFRLVGLNKDGITNIETFLIGNKTIAIAGFNDIHDHVNNQKYADLSMEAVINALNRMNSDVKIISLHWGSEYIMFPSPKQISFARSLIDAGADIIIGHHPHVIQPVEEYNNGLICYSLGNFIFDMHWSKKLREGMVVEIEIDESKKMHYAIKFFEIDNQYTPRIILNPQKNQLKLKSYHNKMLNYLRLAEDGQKKYNKLALRLRYVERIKSKYFWLSNIYKQPFIVRKQNLKNLKSKLMKKFTL